MVEPFGNSVQVPYTPCSHCEDEVREGSVQSNHSELTSKTSTHLAHRECTQVHALKAVHRECVLECTACVPSNALRQCTQAHTGSTSNRSLMKNSTHIFLRSGYIIARHVRHPMNTFSDR